ncbi:hypothetical protein CC78DRAFT_502797 [Lojkania enalia]|uniref:endo-1,3(4)-beta-glucanase n=1 Tax=Lojkania enalia TaxID=147567 RepID=A0A9P4K2M0_9PLEO|nr:hypothetical protein CC78DRAFT_502797 [Didymosphaeria enalia]
MFFSTFLSTAILFRLAIAGYELQDDYMQDFFSQFEFFTAPDPTNGFVQYVDQATALNTGLINATNNGTISWGVDSINQTPQGRPSVRITSKKAYDSGLVVLDVAHMPTGCGTWPAFWMVGPNWPNNGEIDIIEGVNDQETNSMALHTGPNCAISSNQGMFSGDISTDNCDVNAPDQDKNVGCAIKHPSKQSYGSGLNGIQGGVYATEWTDEAITVWFFPRGSIPEDVLGDSPNPSTWGMPAAKFQGACDISSAFSQQQIVFDTTFCGDWAGNVWNSGSCASKADTCEAFVQNNPEAFADAYWAINALKVYQNNQNNDEVRSPVPSTIPSETPSLPSGIPTETMFPTLSPPNPTTVETTSLPTEMPTGTGFPIFSLSIPSTFDTSILAPPPTGAPSFSIGNISTILSSASIASETAVATETNKVPSQPSLTPTHGIDQGPMDGFIWPSGGRQIPGNGNNQEPTTQELTTISASAIVPEPTTVVTVTSAAPPQSTGIEEAPNRVVETIYETVYVTVSGPAQTPAARKARHVRQHRRRLTQHNVRR